jgi:hypothetical protein
LLTVLHLVFVIAESPLYVDLKTGGQVLPRLTPPVPRTIEATLPEPVNGLLQ